MNDSKQPLVAVVDGEPAVRKVISAILEHARFAVNATDDVNVVLRMCETEPPDLVLTNVLLPGITGHDAMRLIRKQYPAIPVLMVAGLPSEPTISEWINEEGFDIFPKPFTSTTLVSKVREVLNMNSPRHG